MRAMVLALGLLLACMSAGLAENIAARDCAAIVADLSSVRTDGDPAAFATVWAEAQSPEAACEDRAIFCIGQSLALGQLEATYDAAEAGGSRDDLIAKAESGLRYGRPWQLEATLGDLFLDAARDGGGGAAYSESALYFQQALIAIGEPPGCTDFGEPSRPATEAVEGLYRRLSMSLLLAEPLVVATTRCAPCQWLFLAGVGEFRPSVRPLPITFPTGSAHPTTEGRAAIAALLQCLLAGGQQRIVLSGHTDLVGSTESNLRLSERRLRTVASALKAGGFAGEIVTEARGEEDPFETEAGFFPPEDELRLSRRIELRDVEGGEKRSCEG